MEMTRRQWLAAGLTLPAVQCLPEVNAAVVDGNHLGIVAYSLQLRLGADRAGAASANVGDPLRFLARKLFPPSADHVAVQRVQFHEVSVAPRLFRADQCRAATAEQIENVLPGRYRMGTNILFEDMATSTAPRAWYPGRRTRDEAAEILVDAGAHVAELQFTLPDVGPRRTIRIRVVDSAGRPVPRAHVSDDSDGDGEYGSLGDNLTTDDKGSLTVQGFERAQYTVSATSRGEAADSGPVEIAPGKGPLTVVLVLRTMQRHR